MRETVVELVSVEISGFEFGSEFGSEFGGRVSGIGIGSIETVVEEL